MSVAAVPLVCLLSVLPGPPGVSYDGGYLHALPINKHKCPLIDPQRDIMFELYTKYNPLRPQRLYLGDDATLAASHADFTRPTLVYVHAYMESANTESPTRIREAILASGEAYNLILVNAPRLEAGPWYPTAAINTRAIGLYLARFIQYLASRGLLLERLHMVGHSLGAQSAGVAGAALGGRVARISGLDPALPKFARQPLAWQLDRGDALFVDIIHTDAGIFGNGAPLGHVDFYPNGGITLQPGCDLKSLGPNAMLVEKGSHPAQSRTTALAHNVETATSNPSTADDQGDDKHFTPGKRLKKEDDTKLFFKEYQQPKSTILIKTKNIHGIKNSDDRRRKQPLAYTRMFPKFPTQNSKPESETARMESVSSAISMLDFKRINVPIGSELGATPKTRKKRSIFRAKNASVLLNIIHFLVKTGQIVIPVVSLIREIDTNIQSGNDKIQHYSRERQSYIGGNPTLPTAFPALNFRLGPEPAPTLLERLFKLKPSSPSGIFVNI